MAAPKGNQFWKLRSEHGRDRLFETAELMWEAACEYFEWCMANPLQEVQYHQGKRVKVPHMRPFTLHGLCSYLGCNTLYFTDFEKSLIDKPHKDFSLVITRIRETIYQQKFEGAACGFLNPNIIARDLGLIDRKEELAPASVVVSEDMISNIANKINSLRK